MLNKLSLMIICPKKVDLFYGNASKETAIKEFQ